METDTVLLRRYAEEHDDGAFATLVKRHLGVVYAAALRRLGGRAQMAEEIAQDVFAKLARSARTLADHPALVAWLYRCTRHAVIDRVRADQRITRLNQSYAAMTEDTSSPETIDWTLLGPVIDASLDALGDRDREAVLLRYFEGLGFAEIGARVRLSENSARMRTTRALAKLQAELAKRGVTSTAAALGLALAHPLLVAAPAGLAASVTSGALSSALAAGTVVAPALFLMKTILTAAVASGLTVICWNVAVPRISTCDVERLRAEQARLQAEDASTGGLLRRVAQLAGTMEGRRISRTQSVAPESVAETTADASAPAGSADASVSPRGHRNRGMDTPMDAAATFAWACDATDLATVARVIWFDPETRKKAEEVVAGLPPSLRARYPTPEAFYGLVIAADSLVYPPPVPEVAPRFETVELSEGRAAIRIVGSNRNFHEYQQTPEGWKFVMPLVGVERWPNNLNNDLLVRLARKE